MKMKNPLLKIQRTKSRDDYPRPTSPTSSTGLLPDADTCLSSHLIREGSATGLGKTGFFKSLRIRIRRTSLRCQDDDSDHGFLQPGPCQGKWTVAAPNTPNRRHSGEVLPNQVTISTQPANEMTIRARRSVPGRLTLESVQNQISFAVLNSSRSVKRQPSSSPRHDTPPKVPERSPVSLGIVPNPKTSPRTPMSSSSYEVPLRMDEPLSPSVPNRHGALTPRTFKPLPPIPAGKMPESEMEEPPQELAPAPPASLLYRPDDESFSVTNELRKLSKCGWYWGPISRSDAELKLSNQLDGTFLVRNSLDKRYLLSLSFRSLGQSLHARIEYENGKFSFFPQLNDERFFSVVELVEAAMKKATVCYSRSKDPDSPTFPVRLQFPVSRFAQVRSLKYLCRFTIRLHIRADYLEQTQLPASIRTFLSSNLDAGHC